MALVARASKTVRNKNLIIVAMCAAFLGWFAYDGYVGYPEANDRLIRRMRDDALTVEKMKTLAAEGRLPEGYRAELENWKGWGRETAESRQQMDELVRKAKLNVDLEGWKNPFDIGLQRWIVWGLAAAAAGSIWWFFHCQRRRVIAEDARVSPAPGVVLPWEKITRVDNTRWKSMGIVEITYLDDGGRACKAKFDDYEVEREALLPILDLLAEKAAKAEFVPKEEPPSPAVEAGEQAGSDPTKS